MSVVVSNIAKLIDEEYKLKTTAWKVAELKKKYSEDQILLALKLCTRGNRVAILEVLKKKISGHYS